MAVTKPREPSSYPRSPAAHLLPLVLAEAAAVRLALELVQERVHGTVICRVRIRTLHGSSQLRHFNLGAKKRAAPSGGRGALPFAVRAARGYASGVPPCVGAWPVWRCGLTWSFPYLPAPPIQLTWPTYSRVCEWLGKLPFVSELFISFLMFVCLFYKCSEKVTSS